MTSILPLDGRTVSYFSLVLPVTEINQPSLSLPLDPIDRFNGRLLGTVLNIYLEIAYGRHYQSPWQSTRQPTLTNYLLACQKIAPLGPPFVYK